MQRRYHVDLEQAERVEETAVEFLAQARASWGLPIRSANSACSWASRLHEIGLDVAHNGYHRHGAYLLENADMPGFAREEQRLLARLVGGHRRKLTLEGLEELIPPWDRLALFLIVLLRLAVLLHRGRSAQGLPKHRIDRARRTLEVRFPVALARRPPLDRSGPAAGDRIPAAHGLRLRVFSGSAAAAARHWNSGRPLIRCRISGRPA